MRIALLFPSSDWMCWSQSHGLAPALEALGHNALPVVCPDTDFKDPGPHHAAAVRVARQAITSADLCIVSAAEKISTVWWENTKTPTALWFADAANHTPGSFHTRYQKCIPLAAYRFHPAAQDAIAYNGIWLPPWPTPPCSSQDQKSPSRHPIAFAGHLYHQRPQILRRIQKAGIPIKHLTMPPKKWDPSPEAALLHALELATLYCSATLQIDLPGACQGSHSRHYEAQPAEFPSSSHNSKAPKPSTTKHSIHPSPRMTRPTQTHSGPG